MIERRKNPRDDFDYGHMKRSELIFHLKAYSDALHKIATECQSLRIRLQKQSDFKKYLHG